MPLSQKQMEYLAIAWQCFENEPKIDYDRFHKLAGLASANSARELMRVTKNKLKEEYGALGGAAPATPKKGNTAAAGVTKTPGSRKRATPGSGSGKGKGTGRGTKGKKGEWEGSDEDGQSNVDDEEAGVENGSPRKRAKGGGKGAAEVKVKEEPQEDEEDEFEEANQFM